MIAFIQPLLFCSLCPFLCAFFDTTLPLAFNIKSAFIKPPLVYLLVPFHTFRYDPVCIFLVNFLGFFTFVRRTALLVDFGARGLLEARAALGALGFEAARRAFFAARRVARLAARLLADFGFEARVALAAIVF